MINRFGISIKPGDWIQFHHPRGGLSSGFVTKLSRLSGYGWRAETAGGSCAIDDVTCSRMPNIRRGCMIEIGTGRPGYRWVQGWEVYNPETGAWSVPMRRADALETIRRMRHA